MQLTIKDDREPWIIYYGRMLAVAKEEEALAREMHLQAAQKLAFWEKRLTELAGRVNEHLGPPDPNKKALDEGELTR